MPLNPVKFGTDVINQFGRYLKTTFPIADPRLSGQVEEALRHQVGGEALLYRGPYVTLNRPFQPGPSMQALSEELGLHPALASTFPFESLHKHQELALRSINDGWHTLLSTGTGSGKTEAFMLPIIEHCLNLRDQQAPNGVVAVLVYPMNALVNDQLERMRRTLAGTRISFGRYTGDTPERAGDDLYQLEQPRAYTVDELEAYKEGGNLPHPWEEAVDRRTIREQRPRILLTNYAQLEYLMLQHRDLFLFQNAPLRFLVFDEVHTYTGELGSEVACLIRRLRHLANKTPDEVICIGTSATITDAPDEDDISFDAEAATRNFAHRLFGVPDESIAFVTEHYAPIVEATDSYISPSPTEPRQLLEDILDAAAEVIRREEPGQLPSQLLSLAEELCGRQASSDDDISAQLYRLLSSNRLVRRLEMLLGEPKLLDDVLPALRQFDGRQHSSDEELTAEVMALLTLGAIAEQDGEPLLRPKLHYFVQGYQGLYFSFEDWGLQLFFEFERGISDTERLRFPLYLCRSCGQHYTEVIAQEERAIEVDGANTGLRLTYVVDNFEQPSDRQQKYTLTDRLHTHEDSEDDLPPAMYLCSICGSLHTEDVGECLNPQCRTIELELIPVYVWEDEPSTCPACGAMNWGNSKRITRARSSDVADVTILSQSMLSAMPEPTMRKLLIFADNRQDAAFQAGWMEERSRRFRLRHLLYSIFSENSSIVWGFDDLVERLYELAQEAQIIVPNSPNSSAKERKRVRWFLLEEFASSTQRRSSLEQLGLAYVDYYRLSSNRDQSFFLNWAEAFQISPDQVVNLVWLLLDHYRQRGILSEPLLSRYWSSFDSEVRDGIISTADYYRPHALVRTGSSDSAYTMGWLAKNGRSAAQVLVKSGIDQGHSRVDEFLNALWHWLIENQYLVQTELIRRRYGKMQQIPVSETLYHVNIDLIALGEIDRRWVCATCLRSYARVTPNGKCPGYRCDGHLHEELRDTEHYDVVQYTQLEFVPLTSYEHSAQVPKSTRDKVEKEFKRADGKYNTIVATPTLEMGVDIGKLEMVLMRNVPPNPANYAQRAGRAGRRHRIAVVMSFARSSQHDRYFFRNPPEMIAGHIRVPAFSMQNEPLVRKHVHSTTLTILRQIVTEDEQVLLGQAFPPYVWAYFGEQVTYAGDEQRFRYLERPPSFEAFGELVARYMEPILLRLEQIFSRTWPREDSFAVTKEVLAEYLVEMPTRLEQSASYLFHEIQRYRSAIRELRSREDEGFALSPEEASQRRRFEYALSTYRRETLQNWTLGYLSNRGFLPGYALSRASVTAQSLEPILELSRPANTALRELTPGSFLYADKKVFQVHKLNFYRLQGTETEWSSDLLRRRMELDGVLRRVFDPRFEDYEGGESNTISFDSYQLTDVEMQQQHDIDDRRDARQRTAYDIYGLLLRRHQGGSAGRVGQRQYFYLAQELVRLVNLGPTRSGPASPNGIGFPICPRCGETRPARASEKEIQSFREHHQQRCRVPNILWTALHVDMYSDVLRIGPYKDQAEAVNVFEALRIGARMVLDMGENEVEGFAVADEAGDWWSVLYDPLPGGSGFLPGILTYWTQICRRGAQVLSDCDCERSCYKCMLHFRNQQYHRIYDRHQASELVTEVGASIAYEYDVPPLNTIEGEDSSHLTEVSDSPAEDRFIALLRQRDFPLPEEAQFRVDLGNNEFTVADYAYRNVNLLIFIDGLSEGIHGNPAQAQRDKLKRMKAKMQGYEYLEIPAAALNDDTMMSGYLDGLSFFLSR